MVEVGAEQGKLSNLAETAEAAIDDHSAIPQNIPFDAVLHVPVAEYLPNDTTNVHMFSILENSVLHSLFEL
jgi:hypothetical protein